jgi:hypothetical protein
MTSISRAIGQLAYVPDKHFCGASEISFVISSPASMYSGLFYRATLPVFIACIVDEPFITISGNYSTVLASIPTPLTSVAVSDPDSTGNSFIAGSTISNIANVNNTVGEVHVTINATKGGTLQVPTLVELSPGEFMPLSWQSGSVITVSGYQGTVNSVLKFLRYVGSSNLLGKEDMVVISLVTPSGRANASLAVRIIPISSEDSISITFPLF